MIDPADGRPASEARHRVEVRRDVRIPMSDGLELSANLWLPMPGAGWDPAHDQENRFPAILEMIPYRKDDWRWVADEARGQWLAARGYAFCRLDIRGTGSSPGIALDEYTAQETHDGYDAVEWLAGQSWSNGKVGMWGISYGGFTSIQVALLRPPHLRAIVPVYASDDRYTDDIHYIGGCPTASELSQYAVSMVGSNALPARPVYRGAAWQAEWRERLEQTPVWLFEWLRRQHDGPYWRQGSLAPHWQALTVPTFLIGGWMDAYVDAAIRMLRECRNAPRRALIGNWVHALPDEAYPGPTVNWLHELVRFFDYWLKGLANGVMDEPALTYFEREYAPPEAFPKTWPGRWRSEPVPGPAGPGAIRYLLPNGTLAEAGPVPGRASLAHRPTIGTRAGLSWGAGWPPNGLARDLRPEEALLPTWTSDPLVEALHLFGNPVARLALSATMPVATLVVRLSDIAPDGSTGQVSAGILNLTHRDGHAAPTALEPGRVETVTVALRAVGYRFEPGHRMRISVASGYWPVIWPSPLPGELTIQLGDSSVALPVVPADAALVTPPFQPSPAGPVDVSPQRVEDGATWRISEDVLARTVTVTTGSSETTALPDGSRLFSSELLEMTASETDPAHARMRTEVTYRLDQDGRAIVVEANALMSSDAATFELAVELDVSLDGAPLHHARWAETIPRRLA
ncbi:MAG: CocE/NonD family hydrolase [Candidatus Limnocylindrales bacterium]